MSSLAAVPVMAGFKPPASPCKRAGFIRRGGHCALNLLKGEYEQGFSGLALAICGRDTADKEVTRPSR